MGADQRERISRAIRVSPITGSEGAASSGACSAQHREDDDGSGHSHRAYDLKFYEQLPKLFPHSPGMAKLFADNPEMVETTAKRNSSLRGAYLIMAARALGLDCGPMSGFDQAKVDEEFFAAGKPCFGCDQEFFPEGHVKTNFLCNLGYGDPSTLYPRLPRLAFSEACSLL